jgi:hypothetical protein
MIIFLKLTCYSFVFIILVLGLGSTLEQAKKFDAEVDKKNVSPEQGLKAARLALQFVFFASTFTGYVLYILYKFVMLFLGG